MPGTRFVSVTAGYSLAMSRSTNSPAGDEQPDLADVMTPTEEVHPDRREHAKQAKHPDDEELERRTRHERDIVHGESPGN